MEAQDYSVSTKITPSIREELQWWENHLALWNGRTLVTEKPSVVIETDASKRGWGRGTLVEIGVQNAHQLPGSFGSLLAWRSSVSFGIAGV